MTDFVPDRLVHLEEDDGSFRQAATFVRPLCAPSEPRPFIQCLLELGFSPQNYLAANPDLAARCDDQDDALLHFFRYGISERRFFPLAVDLQALKKFSGLAFSDSRFRTELLSAICNAHVGPARLISDNRIPNLLLELLTLGDEGCRPFLLIGDSHSNLYRRSPTQEGRWATPVHVLCSAGSARGLLNPNSRSGYGARIQGLIKSVGELDQLRHVPWLFQFGQVDVEFVYTFKRATEQNLSFSIEDYQGFCDQAVQSYFRFLLDSIPQRLRGNVTILSLFPPSLSDEKWKEGYVNGHILSLESQVNGHQMAELIKDLEIPDARTRTRMHEMYNQQLCSLCVQAGFSFVDGFSPFLGAGMTIDNSFIPTTSGADHHLEFLPTQKKINEIVLETVCAA